MTDAILVAWAGVVLTILIQGAAIAFFLGRLSSKTDSLKHTVDTHIDQPMPQAHGCPYFTPEQHQANQRP